MITAVCLTQVQDIMYLNETILEKNIETVIADNL